MLSVFMLAARNANATAFARACLTTLETNNAVNQPIECGGDACRGARAAGRRERDNSSPEFQRSLWHAPRDLRDQIR